MFDVNPEGQAAQPFFDFCKNIYTSIPQYYICWDVFPCVIPNYIYKAIFTYCELNKLSHQQVVEHFKNWWEHLLYCQNTFFQYI